MYSYPRISGTAAPNLVGFSGLVPSRLGASYKFMNVSQSTLVVALDADLRFWVPCSLFGLYLWFTGFNWPRTLYLRSPGPSALLDIPSTSPGATYIVGMCCIYSTASLELSLHCESS